jgi:hypothetical protein
MPRSPFVRGTMMLRSVLYILGVVFFALGLLLALDIYTDRAINTIDGDEAVDLTPVWVTLAIAAGLMAAGMAFNRDPLADRRAPPYMGQMASKDPGEIDKTLEKAGEMKRIGGEY